MTLRSLLAGIGLAITVLWAGSARAAVTLYGLTSDGSGRNLVTFSSEMPGAFSSNIPIFGDVDRQVSLFSLDLNTSDNRLYALGQVGGGQYALFQIATDGRATKVGNLGVNIASENVGLDYDAGAGVFRVVTNDDQLFTVDPGSGQGTFVGTFAYGPSDTRGKNPNLFAAAYNGQYFVLDENGGVQTSLLSTLAGTTLTSRATIAVKLNNSASFDIAPNGEAYFDSGQVADRLYRLDLATGAVIDKGALQLRLTGLTAAPGAMAAPLPEPATWAMLVGGFGAIGLGLRRLRKERRRSPI